MTTPLNRPPAWVADAVFYQIFPDRFAMSGRLTKPRHLEPWNAPPTAHGYKGGDLLGIAERLDWLSDLDVTAVYLNPVFQSASNHRYHTYDYLRIDPLLGGDAAFDALLAACHDRGIRVVLDAVFNHASRGFFQFNDLLENGEASPWRDWFHVSGWPLRAYRDDGAPNYQAWWGLRALPKFNTDNPQVREYLMRVAEHWTRRGIDGWRLDVPEEIHTAGFWEEFRKRVRAINPEAYLVGEIWHAAQAWINDGTRFDGVMNYVFTEAVIAFSAGQRVDPEVVEDASYSVQPPLDAGGYGDRIDWLLDLYPEHAAHANLNLLSSHDVPRLLTVAGEDAATVELATLLLMTFPGAPSVYYGDEIGLGGKRDPDNRRAFPWDTSQHWNEDILEAHRSLIALRHRHPALRTGNYTRLSPAAGEYGPHLYVFAREDAEERLLVAVNSGTATESADIPAGDFPAGGFQRLWGDGEASAGAEQVAVKLAGRRGAVWRVVGGA